MKRVSLLWLGLALLFAGCGGSSDDAPAEENTTQSSYALLQQDVIINADIWDSEPKMLAAGLGFTGIIGVPGITLDDLEKSETLVRLAGGTWNTLTCDADETPSVASYTSAATPTSIAALYGGEVLYADGLPIEFSWPVLPSSVAPENFRVNLNDGTSVRPDVAAVWPNFEYNERSTVVIFGHFGNRVPPDENGTQYPVSVEVVASATPLKLVGPGQQIVDATGLKADSPGSPYTRAGIAPAKRGGPKLVAAKLTKFSDIGDTGPALFQNGLLPNDGKALYGDKAQYRLRVFTSGGMTPDGVRGMHPDAYERFFRIQAQNDAGDTVYISKADHSYAIDGFALRVEGLADLGLRQEHYTDCYREDKDNQIDIILSGDEEAMRKITRVEMPSAGAYDPVYNPGGPGNDPTPGVPYSAPSPPIDIAVTMALDDPMTVTYVAP